MNFFFTLLTALCAVFAHSPCYAIYPLSFNLLEECAKNIEESGEGSIHNHALGEFHEKEVALRGFLLKTKNDQWILSQTPSLKSCCIGAPHKVASQIYIEGSLQEVTQNKLVLIEGVFKIDIKKNNEGKISQLYTLYHPVFVAQEQHKTPVAFLSVLGVATVGGAVYMRKKRLFPK